MNTQNAPQFRKRSLPALAAFAATLLALPVSAVLNVVFKYLYEERYLKSRMYAAVPAPIADPPPRPDV